MDDHSESTSNPSQSTGSLEDQRRRLELQLHKLRSEASAARLEARAAEIELLIQQLGDGPRIDSTESGAPIHSPHLSPQPSDPTRRFRSWDELRCLYGFDSADVEPSAHATPTMTRFDGPEPTIKRPHLLDVVDGDSDRDLDASPKFDRAADRREQQPTSANWPGIDARLDIHGGDSSRELITGEVSVEADPDEEPESRRGKPAAWLASTAVHLALLAILAVITLQTQRPKDQVALSASAAEAQEVSMETFTIETSEPETEFSEPTPSETEYELSPVGQLAATNFTPQAPPAPPSVTAMTSSALSATAAASLSSDQSASIEFCGVQGGGNHFVYLVDSSGSMGDGFPMARAELLKSIEALRPEQRFYVVFFDAHSDYMRLRDPTRDEPRSLRATPEHRAALRRWAMRIEMDRGLAPYEALRFALGLRPDVIFLLSDGEFPQGIEDLLREENKVENLFGDRHPISIVHTIGYHSREGESRMRRIAEQNGGQYRYVAKP